MYLINFSKFLQQLLPPSWQKGWQYSLIHTLLIPIKEHLENFVQHRAEQHTHALVNAQVWPLRRALTLIAEGPVSIEHQSITSPFTFSIYVPQSISALTRKKIEHYVQQHKIAGTNFEIINA